MYGGEERYPDSPCCQSAYNDGYMDAVINFKLKRLDFEWGVLIGLVMGSFAGATVAAIAWYMSSTLLHLVPHVRVFL